MVIVFNLPVLKPDQAVRFLFGAGEEALSQIICYANFRDPVST
jgi:hypothetical protein